MQDVEIEKSYWSTYYSTYRIKKGTYYYSSQAEMVEYEDLFLYEVKEV